MSGRGLTTVVAKMHVWPLGYGGAAPTGTFEDRDDAGTTVHVLMMGTAAQQCGPPLPQDLARDASGTLHVITRLASPIRHRTVIACECPPSTAACGGMAAPPVAIGYELPAGTVYGGAVSIAYDIDDSEVRYPSRCQQALQVP
ncbi:MAG TPA: hypothetical protein VMJ10_24665 [Kofleriaceae bacterium]|nr:hypothetical protein [Kofleriaceae bacterium]